MMITTAYNKCGCSLMLIGNKVHQVSFCLEHLHLFDPDLTTRELHHLWIRIGTGDEGLFPVATGGEDMDGPEPGCSCTYQPFGATVRCDFCGWVPDRANLACYLNTGMWLKEWEREEE